MRALPYFHRLAATFAGGSVILSGFGPVELQLEAGEPNAPTEMEALSAAASLPTGKVGARLFKSGPIQISADGRFVWTANKDNDSVSRIDTADQSVVEFPLPEAEGKHSPLGISIREDGTEVWVACHDSVLVFVLGPDGAVLNEMAMPYGSGPYSVALSRDQSKAVVTLHRMAAVAVVDAGAKTVAHVVDDLFWSPMGIAWPRNDEAVWITHLFAPGEHPLITRIEFADGVPKVAGSNQIFAADPRHSNSLSAPYDVAEGGYLTTRGHPAQIPSGWGKNELWLPIQYNNISEDRYSPDSTVQSTIRRLDLNTGRMMNGDNEKVILTAPHVHQQRDGGTYLGRGWNAQVSGPIDIGFSSDDQMVYVLHELSNDLVVMRTSTGPIRASGAAPLPEIPVGDRPTGIAISPAASRAYVYNQLSRDVSIIDLNALEETARLPITPVTGEKMNPVVLQGAKLFHTSDDGRISRNRKVSCASCHINGEHDGRSWAFHNLAGRHGPRTVPTLLGLNRSMGPRDAERGWGQLHMSGDRDEIQDFEHTFQSELMGGDGFLGDAVYPDLGEPNAGRDVDLDAMAAYLMSLDPLMRSPYRTSSGELTEAAIRGATFFMGSDRVNHPADSSCAVCHRPETGFVDFKFHDVGQRRPSQERELNSRTPAWHVNTPTLLGLWATAPFGGSSGFLEGFSVDTALTGLLEDQAGRVRTSAAHGTPDGLTRRQRHDLAVFLLSIDGQLDAAELAEARDTVPPRMQRVQVSSLKKIDVWFNESADRQSAELIENWELKRSTGKVEAIEQIVVDQAAGDKVTLHVSLTPNTAYELAITGPIKDMADSASDGVANEADTEDQENKRQFHVGPVITITLGARCQANLECRVHDTAMVGPGLSTWSHDSVWLFPTQNNPSVNTGFVRFEWQNAFRNATGVIAPEQIIDARIMLHGEFGQADVIEARRTLKAWSDPISGNDWNSGATGAPTWRDHAHPSSRWNQAGAGALGGTGASTLDYNRQHDLSARVDATAEIDSVNGTLTLGGEAVTEAFRFWLANPQVDYGYALRLRSGASQELKFERTETNGGAHGPLLSITYLAPVDRPELRVERRDGAATTVLWPQGAAGFDLQSSADLDEWMDWPAAPRDENFNHAVDVDEASFSGFFRLIQE